MVNWGSVWGDNKCRKLYGVETTHAEGIRGLNNFFTRLGVTTEFCRSDKNDTNIFGVQPRTTPKHPDWGSDEGCAVTGKAALRRLH